MLYGAHEICDGALALRNLSAACKTSRGCEYDAKHFVECRTKKSLVEAGARQDRVAICGGADSVSADGASIRLLSPREFEVVLLVLLARSLRILLEVPRDGHCGILCLMLPEYPLNEAPPHDSIVRERRTRMADAFREHGARMLETCGLTNDELQARIRVHDEAANASGGCTLTHYVENYFDLWVWSIATGKRVGLVQERHMEVLVFSGYVQPSFVSLDEYAPEPNDILLYHVDGIHYQNLFFHPAASVITTDNVIDEIFRTTDRAGRAPTRPLSHTRPMGGWASFSFFCSGRAGGRRLKIHAGPGGWAVDFSTGRPWASPGFWHFFTER